MRRAKTQLFGRRSSVASHHNPHDHHTPHDYDDTSNDSHSVNMKQQQQHHHHHREDRHHEHSSRSRINLSMSLKGLLAGASLRPRDPPPPRRPEDDVFKWGRKRREVFGARAMQFPDSNNSLVTTNDAPPLRYSNYNLRVAGWLSKKGKRLGSKIDRFFELKGSILSNARSEHSRPTWSVNVRGCKIISGPGNEIIFRMNRTYTSFFAPTEELHGRWMKALRAVSGEVSDFYDFGRIIGHGAYSEVYMAHDKARTELCAVKVLERRNPEYARLIERELAVLRMLNHQNVVQIYDIFDSARQTFVVMEYMAGGELLEMIQARGHLSERDSRQVIREVLQAIEYLHVRGIVHRDVKPENILCVTKAWPLRVKLLDFGLSKYVGTNDDDPDRTMRTQCGTAYYLAPEIANNLPYSKPVDLWACGVVLYVMLAGKFPFYGDEDTVFLRRLKNGVKFPAGEWSRISPDAKSLVRGLLDPNPNTRLTATKALQHRWLVDESDVTASSNPTKAAGEARARMRVQYDANVEPLSLPVVGNSRFDGRLQNPNEFSETDGDVLRTDDLEKGDFGHNHGTPIVGRDGHMANGKHIGMTDKKHRF